MRRFLLRWILLAVSVAAAATLTQMLGLAFKARVDSAEGVLQLFLGVAILALLNATLGKILKFLTIPLNCLTLGLVSLVVNALMLWLAAGFRIGFEIDGDVFSQFLAAFVGSLLVSFINGVLGAFLGDEDKES